MFSRAKKLKSNYMNNGSGENIASRKKGRYILDVNPMYCKTNKYT
jgi:hypothetical protein